MLIEKAAERTRSEPQAEQKTQRARSSNKAGAADLRGKRSRRRGEQRCCGGLVKGIDSGPLGSLFSVRVKSRSPVRRREAHRQSRK